MENASKALIIAGAILIAILLISVAILIINSTGDVTDQVSSQSESMAIQSFNGQFKSYEGKGKSATQVRSLMNAVQASNASNANQVVYGTGSVAAGNLKTTEKYEIKLEDKGVLTGTATSTSGTPDGYIDTITITKE